MTFFMSSICLVHSEPYVISVVYTRESSTTYAQSQCGLHVFMTVIYVEHINVKKIYKYKKKPFESEFV